MAEEKKVGEKDCIICKLILENPWRAGAVALAVILIGVLLTGCDPKGSGGIIPPADGQAAVDTVSGTLPTEYTNGSALPAGSLGQVVIQWGPQGGPYNVGSQTLTLSGTGQNPGTNFSMTVTPGTVLGTRCYVASVRMTAAYNNLSSATTSEVCKTVTGPPKTPTNLKVS